MLRALAPSRALHLRTRFEVQRLASHSAVPILQSYSPPLAPRAPVPPPVEYKLVRRVYYNEADETDSLRDADGKTLGERYWPAGTRKMVYEYPLTVSETTSASNTQDAKGAEMVMVDTTAMPRPIVTFAKAIWDETMKTRLAFERQGAVLELDKVKVAIQIVELMDSQVAYMETSSSPQKASGHEALVKATEEKAEAERAKAPPVEVKPFAKTKMETKSPDAQLEEGSFTFEVYPPETMAYLGSPPGPRKLEDLPSLPEPQPFYQPTTKGEPTLPLPGATAKNWLERALNHIFVTRRPHTSPEVVTEEEYAQRRAKEVDQEAAAQEAPSHEASPTPNDRKKQGYTPREGESIE